MKLKLKYKKGGAVYQSPGEVILTREDINELIKLGLSKDEINKEINSSAGQPNQRLFILSNLGSRIDSSPNREIFYNYIQNDSDPEVVSYFKKLNTPRIQKGTDTYTIKGNQLYKIANGALEAVPEDKYEEFLGIPEFNSLFNNVSLNTYDGIQFVTHNGKVSVLDKGKKREPNSAELEVYSKNTPIVADNNPVTKDPYSNNPFVTSPLNKPNLSAQGLTTTSLGQNPNTGAAANNTTNTAVDNALNIEPAKTKDYNRAGTLAATIFTLLNKEDVKVRPITRTSLPVRTPVGLPQAITSKYKRDIGSISVPRASISEGMNAIRQQAVYSSQQKALAELAANDAQAYMQDRNAMMGELTNEANQSNQYRMQNTVQANQADTEKAKELVTRRASAMQQNLDYMSARQLSQEQSKQAKYKTDVTKVATALDLLDAERQSKLSGLSATDPSRQAILDEYKKKRNDIIQSFQVAYKKKGGSLSFAEKKKLEEVKAEGKIALAKIKQSADTLKYLRKLNKDYSTLLSKSNKDMLLAHTKHVIALTNEVIKPKKISYSLK